MDKVDRQPPHSHRARTARNKSCAECQRLKLKCSRRWPCDQCVRRGTSELCPNATAPHPESKTSQINTLKAKVESLERSLAEHKAAAASSQSNQLFLPIPDTTSYSLTPVPDASTANDTTTVQRYDAAHEAVSVAESVDREIGHLAMETGGQSRFLGFSASEHLNVVAAIEDETDPEQSGMTADRGGEDALLWPLMIHRADAAPSQLFNLMTSLPPKNQAEGLNELYWSLTSSRFEPFTKPFYQESFEEVYSNSSPSPDRLALVYSVLAFSALFDPVTNHLGLALKYNENTKAALMLANYVRNISAASLCAIHLICGYILNSEGPIDELYVITGLGLRLAIAGGYHRDGSWWKIQQPLLDQRRRIWWELSHLERVHSLSTGLPTTLPRESDTQKPNGLSPLSFLWWKWDLQIKVSQCLESARTLGSRDYNAILAADKGLREFDAKLPGHLRCRCASLYTLAGEGSTSTLSTRESGYSCSVALDDDGMPLSLKLQQIRLSQHYYNSLLQLHRHPFTAALHGEPMDGPFAPSVLAVVVESATNIISLIVTLHRLEPKHISYATQVLDLYNGIACLSALLIRCPRSQLKIHCLRHLDEGMEIMKKIRTLCPSRRVEKFYARIVKLYEEAKCSAGEARSDLPRISHQEAADFDESLGIGRMTNGDFDVWLGEMLGDNIFMT